MPEATATITEPVDSQNDGFDIDEAAAHMGFQEPEPASPESADAATPEPEKAPESGAEPEAGTEPEPQPSTLDLNAKFATPVAGKYNTLGDLVKAFENQASLLGQHATKLESAKDAMALMELIRTDPAKAKAKIDELSRPPEEMTLEEAIEMNANPDAWFEKKFAEKKAKTEAVERANSEYSGALKKVYPSFDAMAESRTAIQQAHESGVLGDPELYQLAAMGRSVRDGQLAGGSGNQPETKPHIDPASAGAGRTPKSPTKTAPEKSVADQTIEELDALDIPGL